jgi:hypothetical protein
MAPYLEDAHVPKGPLSPQPLHDYTTIQLTYPNKSDALEFTETLFRQTLERAGVRVETLAGVFGSRIANRSASKTSRGRLPEEFLTLAEKDESFARFAKERGLFSASYVFSEDRVAADIRKVLPVVVARNYYLRSFSEQRAALNRSRKSHQLYSGYPSILEITEGNPRAILTLIGPLVQQLWGSDSIISSVPMALQDSAVRRVELLLTSLLQVIALDATGFETSKGLLDFVDQVGRSFERRLLRRDFAPDYVGTFVVDESVTPTVISAVGKAVNAGAFVHIPGAGSAADVLLRSFIGQRFRISYALAARYRLLLTLGDRVNLSTLLTENGSTRRGDIQSLLFGESDNDS